MTLGQLKKEFEAIAIRYGSKEYLTASYRNYLFDGFGDIYNLINHESTFDYLLNENVQRINNLFHLSHDYEIKAFLIHMKEFAKKHNISKLEMDYFHGKLSVHTYKEVEFEFEDKMPF